MVSLNNRSYQKGQNALETVLPVLPYRFDELGGGVRSDLSFIKFPRL